MVLLAFLLTACNGNVSPSDATDTEATTVTTAPLTAVIPSDGLWEAEDTCIPDTSDATVIRLSDTGTVIEGDGAVVTSTGVTVNKAGVYVVSGVLTDGQLRVETEDAEAVRLVLDGVTIHSESTAPLFVCRSAETVLTLADGSENTLSDSAEAAFEDAENEEPSGALFSKSDLIINGSGHLTVQAAFRDGIVSRDGLKIAGGTLAVTAADDAVMGRDYVLIGGGALTLQAAGDGIKSTNDASQEVGFVTITGGELSVVCDKDGVQAASSLTIGGGTLRVTSGGGSRNGTADDRYDYAFGMNGTSAGKALKAGTVLAVDGGRLTLDAADDALHSNGTVTLGGGTITAASGDDGVHADKALTITDGDLTITSCYEGLEAATITIGGGNTHITASDDGINASSGGSDTSGDYGPMGGRGGMGGDPFAADDSALFIHGGELYVDAQGDGLDSNGSVTMTGGIVSVAGPSDNGNGTFDFASAFEISGGTLIAVGSNGMVQIPSADTMNSIVWGGCTLQSGDSFTVTDAGGRMIASIESPRTAAWAYVLSPSIVKGETYTLSDGYESRTVTHTGGVHQIGYSGSMGGPMGGGRPGGMERPGRFF